MTEKHEFAALTQRLCEQLASIEETLQDHLAYYGVPDVGLSQQLRSVAAGMRALAADVSLLQKPAEPPLLSASLDLDRVTGLPTRQGFDERLVAELRRLKRYHRALSVALFEADTYERIVAAKGYAVADKTLMVVAKYLTSKLRAVDFVACAKSGTFAIILPETGEQQALRVLEKIRLGISKIPFKLNQQPFQVTVSVGITECAAEDNVETVTARITGGVSSARSSGGNRCRVESKKKHQEKKKPLALGISQEFPVISTSFSKL